MVWTLFCVEEAADQEHPLQWQYASLPCPKLQAASGVPSRPPLVSPVEELPGAWGAVRRPLPRLSGAASPTPSNSEPQKRIIVTGAAGFIGFNTGTSDEGRLQLCVVACTIALTAAFVRMPALRAHKRGDRVVGLDSFSAYYAVPLKHSRVSMLARHGVRWARCLACDLQQGCCLTSAACRRVLYSVVPGDVCDADLLQRMVKTYKPTHIVNLAAQAGVRHSLTHPMDYVHSNLECFVHLLEVCHSHPTATASALIPHHSRSLACACVSLPLRLFG